MSITTSQEVRDIINSNDMVLVYFTGMDCGACETIKIKVKSILEDYPKIKFCEISGEKHPEIAASFEVFSLPIMILYVDKKETIRVGRNVSILDIERDISRYYNMIFK